MSTATLQADERARREAADVGRSVLLQAPAGSGKTTVLVCRYLALLAVVDEPEEVLAITFTRRATGEMRLRIIEVLRAVAKGEHVDRIEAPFARRALARDAERGWGVLSSPQRLRIQTIDALNFQLASLSPILSRSGARLTVSMTPQKLYRQASQRMLRAAWQEPSLAAAVETLLQRLDNGWQRLEGLLEAMLARRTLWLPHVLGGGDGSLEARVADGLQTLVQSELASAMARLPADLMASATPLCVHAARELSALNETDEAVAAWLASTDALRSVIADLPRWRLLIRLALKADGEVRRTVNRNIGFPPGASEPKQRMLAWLQQLAELPEVVDTLREISELPQVPMPATDAAALQALSLLLPRAAAELQLEFAATGEVDYSYVAAAARQSLALGGDPTDLALRFGSAIRHVLIDEFQDTSQEQMQLLRALTAGWSTGDGRTLFAVGDPMQSIYQFREAEIGLFLQARDAGVGELRLEGLELRRNFRSGPGVVDWVNERIARLFPAQDDLRLAAVRYLSSQSARPERVASVSVHALPDDDAAREAEEVLATLRDLRVRRPEARIAVLVASRPHAAAIAPVLVKAGFAVHGIDIEPLAGRACVRDLMALTRALQHGGDRTAWLALLHSPMCGLDLPQLQALAEDQDGQPWERLHALLEDAATPPQMATRLRRVSTALRPALEGPERLEPLALRVDRCWMRIGGPAVYPKAAELADATAFLEAICADPDAELLAGEALQERLDGLYGVSAEVPGAIELLTIHGAKGLEWDAVLIPGLGRRVAVDREPLLNWLELPRVGGGSDLLLAPVSDSGAAAPHSVAAYIRRLRSRRQRMERARLLYVTATRARFELHWFGHATRNAAGEWTPPSGTLLELLWPAIGEDFMTRLASATEPSPHIVPASRSTSLVRLTADWQPPQQVAEPGMVRLPLSLHEPSEVPEYSWVGQSARAVGTIVHAELQRLANGEPAQRSDADYATWLAELGVSPGERSSAVLRIVAAMRAVREDARGHWLLSDTHRDAHSERRLTGIHEGRLVNVIIDRTFIDAQGVRWIIDYKTSTHEGGALDAFLASEVDRYRPQLQRYATLAAGLGSEPVRAALYFPLLGQFREVALD